MALKVAENLPRGSKEELAAARRDSEADSQKPSACAEQSAESEPQWAMFAQAIIGQRVTDENGVDVLKLGTLSFTLPEGLSYSGSDIIEATVRRNETLSGLGGEVVSFNADGTLLGFIGKSSEPLSNEALRIFADTYRGTDSVVRGNESLVSENNLEYFNRYQSKRKERLDALEEDMQSLLSTPEHRGASAWVTDFGPAFRMELVFKDGRLMTLSPEGELTEFGKGLVDPDNDFGHAAWLEWFEDFIKTAYLTGAKTIFGFQMDSTISVSMCGGSDQSKQFYQQTMLPDPSQIGYTYGNSAHSNGENPEGGQVNGAGNSSQGQAGSSDPSSTSKSNCSNCGKALNIGQSICTCMTRGSGAHWHGH